MTFIIFIEDNKWRRNSKKQETKRDYIKNVETHDLCICQ